MSKNAMALANIETVIIGESKSESVTNNVLQLSGKITANENASAMQTAHFGGRIERLYFKSEGEFVKKGALLATIYSPDLVTAQNELIEAMDVKELQPELYKAVRNKLTNWKISEKQIQQIERNKKVITNFNMYANVLGYVEEIFAQEGNHVNEGSPLF
jgi:Cu(I)/Ag(I) efflux system membrane fusion protein